MSTRCIACDRELLSIPRHPFKYNEWEEMCPHCRRSGFSNFNYLSDHRYVLEDAVDGVTPTKDVSHL